MSRRRRKAPPPVCSVTGLRKSSQDDHDLIHAIDERFRDLCFLHRRVRGSELPVPKHIKAAFKLYGRALIRHAHEDYRHTDDEIKAAKEIAQWTVDVKRDIAGQPSVKVEFR